MIKNQYFSTKKEMQDYVLDVMQTIHYYIGNYLSPLNKNSFSFEFRGFFIDGEQNGKYKCKRLSYKWITNEFKKANKIGKIYLPNRKKIEFQYDNNLAVYSGINIPKKQMYDYDFSNDYWVYQECWLKTYNDFVDCKIKKIIYDIIYTELTFFITQKPYFK